MDAPILELDRRPTRADLDALPEHVRGEIIDGVLYTMTRPRARHGALQARIAGRLDGPFGLGDGGPGGWWVVIEPGIELPGAPEIAPDLAGWRRERLPELPDDAPLRVVPDWVCEILSPTTRRHDLRVKKPFYARVGLPWLWLVDLDARVLQVNRLHEGQWLEVDVFGDDDRARAAPFDAVEMALGDWWMSPPERPQSGVADAPAEKPLARKRRHKR